MTLGVWDPTSRDELATAVTLARTLPDLLVAVCIPTSCPLLPAPLPTALRDRPASLRRLCVSPAVP